MPNSVQYMQIGSGGNRYVEDLSMELFLDVGFIKAFGLSPDNPESDRVLSEYDIRIPITKKVSENGLCNAYPMNKVPIHIARRNGTGNLEDPFTLIEVDPREGKPVALKKYKIEINNPKILTASW